MNQKQLPTSIYIIAYTRKAYAVTIACSARADRAGIAGLVPVDALAHLAR